MKNVFMFLLLAVSLCAQEIRISCGYSKFNLSSQKLEFESVVSGYNDQITAFKVPIQKEYPANYFFLGSIGFRVENKINIGAFLDGGKTNAYARYRDIVGSVDFKGTFSAYSFGVYLEKQIDINSSNALFPGVKIGLAPYSNSINYKLNSDYFPEINSQVTHSYSGLLLCIEPNIKYEIRLYSSLWFTAHLGYRFGVSVKQDNDDSYIISRFQYEQGASISVNPSGVVVLCGLACWY